MLIVNVKIDDGCINKGLWKLGNLSHDRYTIDSCWQGKIKEGNKKNQNEMTINNWYFDDLRWSAIYLKSDKTRSFPKKIESISKICKEINLKTTNYHQNLKVIVAHLNQYTSLI